VALQSFVSLFRAPDRSGIGGAITPTLAAHGCETLQAHSGAPETGTFFVRMRASSPLAPRPLHEAIQPTMQAGAQNPLARGRHRRLRDTVLYGRFR
jgi:hypothetical protein